MKVALIIRHFSCTRGGLERYAFNLCRALLKQGVEIHVFAHRYDTERSGFSPSSPRPKTLDGKTLFWHPVPMISKPGWLRVLSFAASAEKELKRESFDITYALHAAFPQDLHRLGDGVYRHWMSIRYPFAPSRWFHYAHRPVHLANLFLEANYFHSRSPGFIVANSEFGKRYAQKFYGLPEERIRVIYNGVDHDAFNPATAAARRDEIRSSLGVSPETPVVLFVANDWKRKGLATLLRALAQPSCPSAFHLLILGSGRLSAYRSFLRRHHLSDRVSVIESAHPVEQFYGAGDVLALPTHYDPFANVCLEAMACGLPVITTASNGACELIEEGRNGWILRDARDHSTLAERLGECADLEKLQKMGTMAWSTAQRFTIERNARETLDTFALILHKKQSFFIQPENRP